MALQMEITLENGITITQAYLKVNKAYFEYTDVAALTIELSVFKDKTTYEARKPEIIKFQFSCTGATFDMYFSETALNVDQRNHLIGIYEWLKTMPQFTTAEDV